ncbi:response regulator [Paenibacillus algorifonticola]|uniref:response regulator transcription factor n=1 Tax=Paenibacillus algorifonticola TaxID=684063 RepID=UPI003D2D3210
MIKVMLVDDESWGRDIVRTFGRWPEYEMEIVAEAEDGEEALRLAEKHMPQLIITDMRMPGMDGVKLLNELHERLPHIQIVVISGYDDFKYMQHAIRCQAVDYLLKPIDPKELNAVLSKCAAGIAAAAESRRMLTLDLEWLLSLTSMKQRLRARFNELDREGMQELFGELAREIDSSGAGKPQLLERIIQELLLMLKELLLANSLEANALDGARDGAELASSANAAAFLTARYEEALEQLIQQRKFKKRLNLDEVRQYMEARFAEPISLEQVARAFFVSKEYLSKTFKQEYGCNMTDYILQLRMDKAREWLLDEKLPIKTVAEMAGYEDVTYFYRVFKKHFGIAPGEMRRGSEN